MKTVTINKQDLITWIESNCTSFGDPFLGLYVDVDGNIDCVEASSSGNLMPILTFAGMGGFQDDNDLHVDDENYDAIGVANYIVDDGECLKWFGSLLSEDGSEIECKFEFIN